MAKQLTIQKAPMTQDEIIAKLTEMLEIQQKLHETAIDMLKPAIEAEREACAEICDGFYLSWINIQGRYEFMGEGASECAGAIRARGEA